MSDFKKEKRNYYDWEHNLDNKCISFGDIIEKETGTYEAGFTSMGFYGGYHSRDEEITRLRAEIERKDEALKIAKEELNALWSFYGQNITVNNWHQNGDVENLDTFFEDNNHCAIEKIDQALQNKEDRDGY